MATLEGSRDSAGVRWRDYVGEAAADDAIALPGRPSLYELAAIDRGIWQIIGLEFLLRRGRLGATVFVVDRGEAGARPEERRDHRGEVEVIAIEVADGVAELMRDAFDAISVRLIGDEWADERIRVVNTVRRADH